MQNYNLTMDTNGKDITYFHINYFDGHNPKYALLYKNRKKMLFVNLQLEPAEATYLAIKLNAQISENNEDQVMTEYLDDYQNFKTYVCIEWNHILSSSHT